MLNLPKQFSFSEKYTHTIFFMRWGLFALFIACILFLVYHLLFPAQKFTFDFSAPDANKNTLSDPRNPVGELNKTGKLFTSDPLIFDAGIAPGYSLAKIKVKLREKKEDAQGTVTARRGHRAFFADQSHFTQSKDGALFAFEDDYYIMSEGNLRKFRDAESIRRFGWSLDAFKPLTNTEFSFQEIGEPIQFQYDTYPTGTYFLIRGTYYQLNEERLDPFVSKTAFQTTASTQWVLKKDNQLFALYPPTKKMIGFRDGTIISFNDSIYIISDHRAHPIADAITFETFGYSWDDVIQVNSEEFGLYTKAKLLTLKQSHPDGTLFKTTEKDQLFLYEHELNHEIFGDALYFSDIQNTPIDIEAKSLEHETSCELKNSKLPFQSSWSCLLPFDSLINAERSDYQFNLSSSEPINITHLEVTFRRTLSKENIFFTLSTLKNRLLLRFTD